MLHFVLVSKVLHWRPSTCQYNFRITASRIRQLIITMWYPGRFPLERASEKHTNRRCQGFVEKMRVMEKHEKEQHFVRMCIDDHFGNSKRGKKTLRSIEVKFLTHRHRQKKVFTEPTEGGMLFKIVPQDVYFFMPQHELCDLSKFSDNSTSCFRLWNTTPEDLSKIEIHKVSGNSCSQEHDEKMRQVSWICFSRWPTERKTHRRDWKFWNGQFSVQLAKKP